MFKFLLFFGLAVLQLQGALGGKMYSHSKKAQPKYEAQPPKFEWESKYELNPGVWLKWIGSDDDILIMKMTSPGKGYMAIGFTPSGGMRGSDIVMAWIDSEGKANIRDLHAVGNEVPLEDEQQDYEILWGEENENGTDIIFSRRWNTCDKNDMHLNLDTFRVIWAWSDTDPSMESPFNAEYHGTENRGIRSIQMRDAKRLRFPDDIKPPPKDVHFWDLMMDKLDVNEEDTTYWCKVYKPPYMDKKHQMIGFRVFVEPGNEDVMHHVIVYQCTVPKADGGSEKILEPTLDHPGGRCFTEAVPNVWASYCIAIPMVWTVGHEGLMYPENVGLPIGEQFNGTTYFMLEMHYDNKRGTPFKDSSGIRIFVTDTPRENDMNSLLVGQRYSPFNTMPKGATAFTTKGLCTKECTSKAFPKDGITAFQAFPHGHTVMTGFTLHHIRDGVELPPIVKDSQYDFDYQQTRVLPQTVKILPGDEIILDCDTATVKENRTVYGGIATREEMCITYLYYWPRMELAECRTDMEFNSYFNALGVEKVQSNLLDELGLPWVPKPDDIYDPADPTIKLQVDAHRFKLYEPGNIFGYVNITEPANLVGKTVGDIIVETPWDDNNETLIHEFQSKLENGDHYAYCTKEGRLRIPLDNYIVKLPKYKEYVDPEDTICERKNEEQRKIKLWLKIDKGKYNQGNLVQNKAY